MAPIMLVVPLALKPDLMNIPLGSTLHTREKDSLLNCCISKNMLMLEKHFSEKNNYKAGAERKRKPSLQEILKD